MEDEKLVEILSIKSPSETDLSIKCPSSTDPFDPNDPNILKNNGPIPLHLKEYISAWVGNTVKARIPESSERSDHHQW